MTEEKSVPPSANSDVAAPSQPESSAQNGVQPTQAAPIYRFQSSSAAPVSVNSVIFENVQFPQVLPYRFATPSKSSDSQKAPDLWTTSTDVPVNLDPWYGVEETRPSVYRFAMPSEATLDRATDFSDDAIEDEQRQSVPKGLWMLVLLISPFVLLLVLSSLPLFGDSSPPGASVAVGKPNTPGTAQFDYSPILQRADELVQRNELRVALRLLSNVPQASQKRNDIASDLVRRAKNAYPGDVDMAVYILSNVPSETAVYGEAQSLLGQWTLQLNQLRAAEFAVGQQQWDEAARQLDGLKETSVSRTERFTRLSRAVKDRSRL